MLRPASGLKLLAFLLLLSTSSSAVHNDATESVNTQLTPDTHDEQAIEDTNQASNGGRRLPDVVRNGESKRLRMTWLRYHLRSYFCLAQQSLTHFKLMYGWQLTTGNRWHYFSRCTVVCSRWTFKTFKRTFNFVVLRYKVFLNNKLICEKLGYISKRSASVLQ